MSISYYIYICDASHPDPSTHLEDNDDHQDLCFTMWYLVAMEIRVMLFLLVRFFIWYIVQVESMCVPILRSSGSELTKLENMHVLLNVTWRKDGTSYVMGTSTLLIGILTRNIVKPTRSRLYDFRFKSYGSNSGFRVFGDLYLDLWPMFYLLVTRIAHDVLEYPCEVS